MIIGVPKEITGGEKRVAVVPDTVVRMSKKGFSFLVQKGAGYEASFTDEMYEKAGAKIAENAEEVFSTADVIVKVQKPEFNSDLNKHEIDLIKKGNLLITFMYSLHYTELAIQCAKAGVNVISMDAIPRTTLAQKMDALSSQANLAGYKSVIIGTNALGKIFPLMMTAAGTISPAKVVIMGAGVAGLQAIGTAKRLGAIVEVSDIRPQVKEEVESLGGRFIMVETDESMQDAGGYAKEASEEFLKKQKELIFKHVTEADLVITTALVPGRKSPVLVTEEMVKNMKPGSVIVDIAVEFGGNCELSERGKVVEKYGVKIFGEDNLASKIAVNASEVYSKNIMNLIEHISDKEANLQLKLEDEIVKGSLICYNGEIVHERTKSQINNY